KAEPARPRARQFVGRGELQLPCELRALHDVGKPFTSRLLAIGSCPHTVVGSLRSIGCCPRPVAHRPHQDVLPTRIRIVVEVVQPAELVTTLGTTITKRRSPVAFVRRSQPRGSTLVADRRYGGTVAA